MRLQREWRRARAQAEAAKEYLQGGGDGGGALEAWGADGRSGLGGGGRGDGGRAADVWGIGGGGGGAGGSGGGEDAFAGLAGGVGSEIASRVHAQVGGAPTSAGSPDPRMLDAGLSALCEALRACERLTSLCVRGNGITGAGVAALAHALTVNASLHKGLTELECVPRAAAAARRPAAACLTPLRPAAGDRGAACRATTWTRRPRSG